MVPYNCPMCYSAMVEEDLRKLERTMGAKIDYDEFGVLYEVRLQDRSIKTTKAMDANFLLGGTPEIDRIRSSIDQFRAGQRTACETELFKQKTRLNNAQRALAARATKKAAEDRRIASEKVVKLEAQLRDLNAPADLKPSHSRIFPMVYAPVIVEESGQRWIRPMRYHCRPNGSPELLDRRFEGLYNARRDTMNKAQSIWKPLFGRNHGILVATSFYENVALHDFERRELRPGEKPSNVVLHFNPQHAGPMLVACLWDRWQSPGKPDLLSFAAVTDEPPEEVAATGHDRCIVPLKAQNVDAWLKGGDVAAMDALLVDRQRPYYEHRLAA